jgi:hypothetical protein
MRIVVCILLLIHGLITMAQYRTGFNLSAGVANPVWLNWWPVNLGQSWLFRQLGMEKTVISTLVGILWIIAGLCLVAAALGLFGFILPVNLWRPLAAAGAILSLVFFVFYAHPFYLLGIGANIAILLVLLWARWPAPEILGS